MFSLAKLSLAVVTLVSFAQATITINQPNIKGNSSNTISWTSTDPNTDAESFTVELINPSFNKQFALANNVPTSDGSVTFTWPDILPQDTYQIEFVDNSNINNVLATSASFFVAENDVGTSAPSTATPTAGSGSSAVASSASPSSVTSARSSTISTVTQTSPTSSSTVLSSLTGISSAATPSSAGTTTSTSASSSIPSASAPNGASKELIPSGSFAALIAGALALLF